MFLSKARPRAHQIFSRISLAFCLMLLLWTSTLEAQTDQETQNKYNIAAFIDAAYNRGDTDTMLNSLFAPNYALHPGGFDTNRLRINILSLRAALPDLQATQIIVIAEGDWVAVHADIHGTFTNEYLAPNTAPMQPTHEALQFITNMVFHFDANGQVYEQWTTFDNLSYFAQLGIVDFPHTPWHASTEPVTEYAIAPNEDNNRLLAFQYYDAMDRGDVGTISNLLAPEFIGNNPLGYFDKAGQLYDLNSVFGAFPDLGVRIDSMIVDNNYVAVLYNMHGTFSQNFFFSDGTSVAPTNRSLDLIRIDFLRFNQAGQIAESYEIYDNLDFIVQVGILQVALPQ